MAPTMGFHAKLRKALKNPVMAPIGSRGNWRRHSCKRVTHAWTLISCICPPSFNVFHWGSRNRHAEYVFERSCPLLSRLNKDKIDRCHFWVIISRAFQPEWEQPYLLEDALCVLILCITRQHMGDMDIKVFLVGSLGRFILQPVIIICNFWDHLACK